MESQDLGETYPVSPCPECKEKTYYHLIRTDGRRVLSLPAVGSVPIPATEKTRFRLVCPYCSNSIGIDGTDIEEAKVMLESTQKYIEDDISEEKYGERIERFHEVLEEI
jgi:hypothetical protein